MSISGKDKEGTDRSILENNNKNNSTQFKVAFITQAAVIAALYVVLLFCLTIAASDQYSSE